MTQTDTHSTTHTAHGEDAHPPHLQHHFDTSQQQYEASKFGMWIFLATEILMFGGLFCAYAIYRGNHEEIFYYCHYYLSTKWGAINTVILLASSLTMAWAVRASQLGQQRLLITMLALTLAGGFGFMGVKTIEYYEKFEHNLAPGTTNLYYPADRNPLFADAADPQQAQLARIRELEVYYGLRAPETVPGHEAEDGQEDGQAAAAAAGNPTSQSPDAEAADGNNAEPTSPLNASQMRRAPEGPRGLADDEVVTAAVAPDWLYENLPAIKQDRTHLFFQTYFMMTGLHGIHVLVGMGLIAFLLWKAVLGAYSPTYYTPVDVIGLYWHLVDLIWIFLFPLLYLIH